MKKLLSLLLFITSLPSLATERQFDIELIIFKRLAEPEQSNEYWPTTLPPIDLTGTGTFGDHQYRRSNYVTMRAYDEYQLLKQAEQLRKHAGYEVLFHKVWRQNDQTKASAPKFHLYAGEDYSKTYHTDGRQKAFSGANNLKNTQDNTSLYELDGILQIYVQHYLFLETQLDLRIPGIEDTILTDQGFEFEEQELTFSDQEFGLNNKTKPNKTAQMDHLEKISPIVQEKLFLKSYRMKQKRRIRSGEIHYLDHPLMGIILQIRRAPKP